MHQLGSCVSSALRDDYICGYSGSIISFGWRFGIYWTSDEEFLIDPTAKPSDLIERAALVERMAELREDLLQAEDAHRQRAKEHQAPGFFLGRRRALNDIARELRIDEG